MNIDAINSLVFREGERNGSSSPRGGSFKYFCHVTPRKGIVIKSKRSKSWPKSVGYGKGKEGSEDGKYEVSKIVIGSCAGRSSRGSYKEKSSNIGLSFDDGWSCDERTEDWSPIGWHEGLEDFDVNSAVSFSLGRFVFSWFGEQSKALWTCEDDVGHRSRSEQHISIEFRSRWCRRQKTPQNGPWWVHLWRWALAISRLRREWFVSISDRKTHRCTRISLKCARTSNERIEQGSGPKWWWFRYIWSAVWRCGSRGSKCTIETQESHQSRETHSRTKQQHGGCGHVVYRSWCVVCVEDRGFGGQNRIELSDEQERETTFPIVVNDYGFMIQTMLTRSQILMCRNSVCGQRVGPAVFSISFLVRYMEGHGFQRHIFKRVNEPSTKSCESAMIQACWCGCGSAGATRGWSHGQWSCGDGCTRGETTMQNRFDLGCMNNRQGCESQMTDRCPVDFQFRSTTWKTSWTNIETHGTIWRDLVSVHLREYGVISFSSRMIQWVSIGHRDRTGAVQCAPKVELYEATVGRNSHWVTNRDSEIWDGSCGRWW